MKEYDVQASTYIPAKAERLNNTTSRSTAAPVLILFLFKKEDDFVALVRANAKRE
jgi:hypothetical protein